MNKILVTSLKLSRSLEKRGAKQESEFMWVKYELWKDPQLWLSDVASDIKVACLSGKREYEYSAFLSGELGEMLPSDVATKKDMFFLSIDKLNGHWSVCYSNSKLEEKLLPKCVITHKETLYSVMEKNLSEAMGKMLQYLIKNKLIEI